jgi:Bacterial Ig-like domain (group 2)
MQLLPRALIALSAIPSLSLTWISAFGIASQFGTLATTVVLVSVTPASASISPGRLQQYIATATYANGKTADVTRAALWGSSDRSVATVKTDGHAFGVSEGSATIRAFLSTKAGTATLQVSGPSLQAISVTPASVSPAAGVSQQFHATGTYSDHSQKDLTAIVDWTSSNPAAATIDDSGTARAVDRGTASIQANAGENFGSASVTVSGPALKSILVAPSTTTLKIGSDQQLTATGTYENGRTADLTQAALWATDSASAAVVSQAGILRAVSSGAAKVRATVASVTGAAAVTVAPAVADETGCDGKGNCYIYSGAKGTGSGANWTNAYTGVGLGQGQVDPGQMNRGVTYWIANGNYGAQTFATPDKGTDLITIKGATVASHGPASDWNDAYAGQAVFGIGSTRFLTDYWTFDGQTRGADWQSGYTIKFDLNGVDTHGGVITTRTITGAASNLTFDYVEVRGSNMNYTTDGGSNSNCRSYCDAGFLTGSPTNHLYVGHSWIHDVGDTQFQSNINTSGNSNGSDWTIEYNYISRDHTGDQGAGNHSEAFSSTVQNMIVRYNYFQDIISSGVITDASGGTPDVGPWYIYGNIVFWTDKAVMKGRAAGLGDGFVSMFGENMHGTSYIVGNTIANLGHQQYCDLPGTACAMYFLYTIGEDSGTPTWYIQNNLVWKVQGRCVYGSPRGWSFHSDYNASFQSPGFDNCGHHAQNAGGKNPFANWDGSGTQLAPYPSLDFQLAVPTEPGINAFSTVPEGCTPGVNCANTSFNGLNYGANGNYDRGAMQSNRTANTLPGAKKKH